MSLYIVKTIRLADNDKNIKNSEILVWSNFKNCPDIRNTKVFDIVNELRIMVVMSMF